jgi:hypothetical protein
MAAIVDRLVWQKTGGLAEEVSMLPASGGNKTVAVIRSTAGRAALSVWMYIESYHFQFRFLRIGALRVPVHANTRA